VVLLAKFSEHLNKDIADVKTSAEWDGSKWINKVKAQEIEDALATLLTKAGFDAKADVTLSALRDALRGTGSKTLSDLATALGTLNSKDFATETTLAAILAKIISAPATEAKQNSLETVLKAIRDSAGIKKITDALPAGTNKIGKVDVDSSALPIRAATEAKQDSLLTQTDIKLSALRDAIRGVDDKTLSDLAASLFFLTQNILSEEDFIAKADIKMSALRDAITAAGANAKTLKDLHDKLTSLETEIKAIKDTAGIKKINDTVDVQLTGSIPEYNWFTTDGRPTPKEPTKPAIGVEVDADTMEITGLLWNGQEWEAR
jgi:hypothetical protein